MKKVIPKLLFSSAILSTITPLVAFSATIQLDKRLEHNTNNSSETKIAIPTNSITISASSVFDSSTVSGDIYVEISGTSLSIVRYDETNFCGTSPSVLSAINISGTEIDSIIFSDSCFDGCTTISGTIKFSSLVSQINSSAFQSCSNLTGADFYDCTSLTTIGSYAFAYCNLLSLSIDNVTHTITTLKEAAFTNNYNLSYLYIGQSVETLEIWAFTRCGFKEIQVSENNKTFSVVNIGENGYGLLSGASYSDFNSNDFVYGCFYGEISFEDYSIEEISLNRFSESLGLTGVIITQGIIEIEDLAFSNCYNLSYIKIESTVLSSISPDSFSNCNIKDITCTLQNPYFMVVNFTGGKGLLQTSKYKQNILSSAGGLIYGDIFINSHFNSISTFCFDGTGLVTSINIPSSVTKIGSFAIDGCYNLSSLTLNWNEEQLESIISNKSISSSWIFQSGTEDFKIYVPYGLKDLYEQHAADLYLEDYTFVESDPSPTPPGPEPTPTPEPSNKSLLLELGLGLGLPIAGIATISVISTIYIKKTKVKNLIKNGQQNKK